MQLIARKLLTLIIFIPLLSILGFYFAATHPTNQPPPGMPRQFSEEFDYPTYLKGVLAGDLGEVGSAPIREVLVDSIKNSLVLLSLTMVITFIGGPLLGYFSISKRTRRIRPGAVVLTTIGQSMPGFFLGVVILALMIYGIFSLRQGRTPLPISGYGLDEHLILPVLVLATGPMLQVARVTANMLENEFQQDYIRVAESKGLAWPALFWRHAFPNIISAVFLTLGRSARWLVSGLLVVETLFLWPGLGRIFTYTVGVRIDGREPIGFYLEPDMLSALAVVFGVGLLLADLLTSVLAYWSDPRLNRPVEA